jgi:hypothetical protein
MTSPIETANAYVDALCEASEALDNAVGLSVAGFASHAAERGRATDGELELLGERRLFLPLNNPEDCAQLLVALTEARDADDQVDHALHELVGALLDYATDDQALIEVAAVLDEAGLDLRGTLTEAWSCVEHVGEGRDDAVSELLAYAAAPGGAITPTLRVLPGGAS